MEEPAVDSGLVNKILTLLGKLADPQEAQVQKNFYKRDSNITLIGIKVPCIRKVVKDIVSSYTLHKKSILNVSEKLVSNKVHEYKMAGIILLELNKNKIIPSDLETIKRWFLNDYINDWAVIDTLCLAVISSLVEQSKEAQDTVMEWRKHENIYIKRASIVSFIKHAKRKELIDTLLRHASTFLGINHDLITKANGWLLREIGKSNPQKLEGFLTKNIKKIPRTTLRYAIEKFPETKRKWILKIPYK